MKTAWSTISYANGEGFDDHFTKDTEQLWQDIREMNFTSDDYRQPAMFKPKKETETHGGEDVPVLATGPWAHLFVGVHEHSYFAHAIEHAAGWKKNANPIALEQNHARSITVCTFLVPIALFFLLY